MKPKTCLILIVSLLFIVPTVVFGGDSTADLLGSVGCVYLIGAVVLALFWMLIPFILNATREWTKKSHAELVKQTAILNRIEETLVRMEGKKSET